MFTIPLKFLRKKCIKKNQNLGQIVWNKMIEILGHSSQFVIYVVGHTVLLQAIEAVHFREQETE